MLPDHILLEIFDQYLGEDQDDLNVDAWYPLVHVCLQWRNVVFRSPHRLNLRLFYTAKPGKSASEMLGVWPAFPIIIQVNGNRPWSEPNVLAALEHKDRIRKIQLVDMAGMALKAILLKMQEPFPALTDLVLMSSTNEPNMIIPESFLGWSAPRLRSLTLCSIRIPPLLNLVSSSARDLVDLSLLDIPCKGYIPVTKMVNALSVLTKLETLSIEFSLERRRYWDRRYPPPPTRSVLPSLKSFLFKGICGYLEDFVAMIDAPRLEILDVTICKYNKYPFNSDETPQFNQFLGRSTPFKTLNNASVHLWPDKLEITLSRRPWASNAKVTLRIICQRNVYAFGRVCYYGFIPLSKIENLGISSQYHKWESHREATEKDTGWVIPLFFFDAVKSLYLSKDIVPYVAGALKGIVDSQGTPEPLPPVLRSLQKISTDMVKLPSGSVKNAIEQYAAMRELSAPDPPTVPFSWVANKRNAGDL